MDFNYEKEASHEAYGWVLLDCMLSDQMFFLRQEGGEETRTLLTPVIEMLESITTEDIFPNYDSGTSRSSGASPNMESSDKPQAQCRLKSQNK